MALEIVADRYGESKKTLHDLILLILAKEYPMTAGEIVKYLRQQFNVKLTFHAIRKSLLTLVERKILDRKDKKFSIDKNYILETKRLSDQLLKNYFKTEKQEKNIVGSMVDAQQVEYRFENLLQADKFWGEVVLDWARNLKSIDDHEFFFQGPHCWYPIGHLGVESEFLNELKDYGVRCFYVIDEKSSIDQWIKGFYDDFSVHYLINPQRIKDNRTALGVFGEYIIKFDYPDDIYNELQRFYSSSKDIASIELSIIANLLKKKSSIKLIMSKDKVITTNLKNQMKSLFKR